MGKVLILILLLLLDFGSISGYVYINKKIIVGEMKIVEGKIQLMRGERMLAKGKARLNEGQRKLSHVKKAHNTVQSIPFIRTANKLPVIGTPSKIVRNKIAEGNTLVAKGKDRITSGEAQLKAGKLELQSGIERLKQANAMRTFCLIGGICFTSLLIVLGFYWRRSLIKIFRR
jgi:hypothetical protein